MSADGARRLDNQYQYGYEGNLALERMRQRDLAREAAFESRRQAQTQTLPKNRINYGNLVVLILVTFGVIFALLYTQTLVQQNNITINSMKSELSSLQEESARLELDLVMSEDIDSIRIIAINDLNMHAPAAGQIIPVKLVDGADTGG